MISMTGSFSDRGRGVEWAVVGETVIAVSSSAPPSRRKSISTPATSSGRKHCRAVFQVQQTLLRAGPDTILRVDQRGKLNGSPGGGVGYRKTAIITNLDPALDLDVLCPLIPARRFRPRLRQSFRGKPSWSKPHPRFTWSTPTSRPWPSGHADFLPGHLTMTWQPPVHPDALHVGGDTLESRPGEVVGGEGGELKAGRRRRCWR